MHQARSFLSRRPTTSVHLHSCLKTRHPWWLSACQLQKNRATQIFWIVDRPLILREPRLPKLDLCRLTLPIRSGQVRESQGWISSCQEACHHSSPLVTMPKRLLGKIRTWKQILSKSAYNRLLEATDLQASSQRRYQHRHLDLTYPVSRSDSHLPYLGLNSPPWHQRRRTFKINRVS